MVAFASIELVVVGAPQLCAQTKSTDPMSFEVASIKLDKSASPLPGMHFPPGRFIATTTAAGLIAFAYNLKSADQLSQGPGWIRTELFDIEAKFGSTLPPTEQGEIPLGRRVDQARPMVQALLAERFKLKVSHETKVLPVYLLILARNGRTITEDDSHPEIAAVSMNGAGKLSATSAAFNTFSNLLSKMPELEGRLVLDETGLHGNYTFTLHWTPQDLGAEGTHDEPLAVDSSGPSLFTALQEQLGLKLESSKSPQDVIAIDYIEPPSPN